MGKKVKICMAQIDVAPAQPQTNRIKILDCIAKAKRDGAEVIVLNELCIPGYFIGDIWERSAFLNECQAVLEDVCNASENITIVIGSIKTDIAKKNEDGRIRKYNTCFIFKDRVLVDYSIKTLQPNYREFDDDRHFYSMRKLILDEFVKGDKPKMSDFYYPKLITENGIKIGFALCEDLWDADYTISPADMLFNNGCDMIINISCSPYTQGKNNKRNRVFGGHAKKYGKPIVYVNNVGCQNNGKTVYTFDGNSCIYDKLGNQINPYSPFEEGCKTIEIDVDEEFGDPNYNENDSINMLYESILYGTKIFMKQMGINKVVIGASGGIDSSVVAAIMSKILPPENILLVNMPSRFNSDMTKNAAKQLAENIGCRYIVHPIENVCQITKDQISILNRAKKTVKIGEDGDIVSNPDFDPNEVYKFNPSPFLSEVNYENVQARDRSSRVLAAWASWFGGVFTCNANKTEATVGYTTLYGDLGGFLAILADLWKTQVYAIAKYINLISDKDIIPKESMEVKASAELSEKQDVTKGLGDPMDFPYHDKLFASFVERWDRATPEDVIRWYMADNLEKEIGYEGNVRDLFKTDEAFVNDLERWWRLFSGLSVAKRIQSPPILAVSRRSFGFDMRESQVPTTFTEMYKVLKNQLLKIEEKND